MRLFFFIYGIYEIIFLYIWLCNYYQFIQRKGLLLLLLLLLAAMTYNQVH